LHRLISALLGRNNVGHFYPAYLPGFLSWLLDPLFFIAHWTTGWFYNLGIDRNPFINRYPLIGKLMADISYDEIKLTFGQSFPKLRKGGIL